MKTGMPRSSEETQDILGNSFSARRLRDEAVHIGALNASVFITGEAGTGKKLCAMAIHKNSRRSVMPFIEASCATMPLSRMEELLFGSVLPHSTNSHEQNKFPPEGLLERAAGGTLYLDHIETLSPGAQIRLLRFLETNRLQRLGENGSVGLDIRLICASAVHDFGQLVQSGKFRDDLFQKLSTVKLEIPPLRQRREDIMPLADRFLDDLTEKQGKKFKRFTPNALDMMVQYKWPGNVRELKNTIAAIVALFDAPQVDPSMLPDAIRKEAFTLNPDRNSTPPYMTKTDMPPVKRTAPRTGKNKFLHDIAGVNDDAPSFPQIKPLTVIEREIIEEAIEMCGGSVIKAAQCLEVSPSTLYRKLERWRREDERKI